MVKSANGLEPDDIGRMHMFDWVMVQREAEQILEGPRQIIHDTGHRVWVWVNYSETSDLPVEIGTVTDGTDEGWDINGNRIMSIPADWCTFIDEDEAVAILKMKDAADWSGHQTH